MRPWSRSVGPVRRSSGRSAAMVCSRSTPGEVSTRVMSSRPSVFCSRAVSTCTDGRGPVAGLGGESERGFGILQVRCRLRVRFLPPWVRFLTRRVRFLTCSARAEQAELELRPRPSLRW